MLGKLPFLVIDYNNAALPLKMIHDRNQPLDASYAGYAMLSLDDQSWWMPVQWGLSTQRAVGNGSTLSSLSQLCILAALEEACVDEDNLYCSA